MEQPKDFKLSDKEKKVQQLYKALYSLKQTGLSLWQTMTKSILTLGFKQYKSNTSIYYFINKRLESLLQQLSMLMISTL